MKKTMLIILGTILFTGCVGTVRIAKENDKELKQPVQISKPQIGDNSRGTKDYNIEK